MFYLPRNASKGLQNDNDCGQEQKHLRASVIPKAGITQGNQQRAAGSWKDLEARRDRHCQVNSKRRKRVMCGKGEGQGVVREEEEDHRDRQRVG